MDDESNEEKSCKNDNSGKWELMIERYVPEDYPELARERGRS
jgi:hypothetical protein